MKTGRPTKYNPDRAKRIVDAVALGATYHLAGLYAGVNDHTLTRWRAKYPDFDADVTEAEGRGAVGWLARIEKSANDGEWTAAAWKLERRYPAEYGRRVQEVVGKDNTPLLPERAAIDFDSYARAVAAVLAPGWLGTPPPDGDGESVDSPGADR